MTVSDIRARVDAVYDRTKLRSIARRHKIEGHLIKELQWWVKRGALRALLDEERRKPPEEDPAEADRRRRRSRMARNANALLEDLQAEEQDGVTDLTGQMFELSNNFRMRATISTLDEEFSAEITGVASLAEAKFANEILRQACERALDKVPAKPGPKPNQGIDDFASYIAVFYEEKLNRKFTLDTHVGEPLTDAFDFLRDCVSPIIHVPESRLRTAAKRAIAERRASTVSAESQ